MRTELILLLILIAISGCVNSNNHSDQMLNYEQNNLDTESTTVTHDENTPVSYSNITEYKEHMPTNQSQESDEQINDNIVCNIPYIRIADTCCLDRNNNSICDYDENLMRTPPNRCMIDIEQTDKPIVELITPRIEGILDWNTEFTKSVAKILRDKIDYTETLMNEETPQGLKVNGVYVFPIECVGKIYINGIDYNEFGELSEKGVLKKICIAFKEPPEECDTDLCDNIQDCKIEHGFPGNQI